MLININQMLWKNVSRTVILWVWKNENDVIYPNRTRFPTDPPSVVKILKNNYSLFEKFGS